MDNENLVLSCFWFDKELRSFPKGLDVQIVISEIIGMGNVEICQNQMTPNWIQFLFVVSIRGG